MIDEGTMTNETGWKLQFQWVIHASNYKDCGYEWTLDGPNKRLLVRGTRLYKSKASATKAAIRELKSLGLNVTTV